MKPFRTVLGTLAGVLSALVACSHEAQSPSASAPSSALPTAEAAPPSTPPTAHDGARSQSRGCPIHGQNGVQVAVTDTPDGAAITFSAVTPDLDQLRSDIRAMDQANVRQGDAFAACSCVMNSGLDRTEYKNGSASGTGGDTSRMNGTSGVGESTWPSDANPQTNAPPGETQGQTMRQPMSSVPADTSVDDTPTGGVLRFQARDPSQVQALREAVRSNLEAMQLGCGGAPRTP